MKTRLNFRSCWSNLLVCDIYNSDSPIIKTVRKNHLFLEKKISIWKKKCVQRKRRKVVPQFCVREFLGFTLFRDAQYSCSNKQWQSRKLPLHIRSFSHRYWALPRRKIWLIALHSWLSGSSIHFQAHHYNSHVDIPLLFSVKGRKRHLLFFSGATIVIENLCICLLIYRLRTIYLNELSVANAL